MKKIAIIDMGSDSVRLILVKIKDDNSFQVEVELKETVRLGQDHGRGATPPNAA